MVVAEQAVTGDAAEGKTPEEERPVLHAHEGTGPLVQRDYYVPVEGSLLTPEHVISLLRAEFPRFSPEELADFLPLERPLQIGDTMHVHIKGAGHCGVAVKHLDARTLTVRTLEGHPEAGRITFGAECTEDGLLLLRIRSRARASGPFRYAAWVILGKQAQSLIWIRFLERLAEATGGRALGEVVMETQEVPETPADRGQGEAPTFSTEG